MDESAHGFSFRPTCFGARERGARKGPDLKAKLKSRTPWYDVSVNMSVRVQEARVDGQLQMICLCLSQIKSGCSEDAICVSRRVSAPIGAEVTPPTTKESRGEPARARQLGDHVHSILDALPLWRASVDDHRTSHAGAGGGRGRSFVINRRNSWNNSFGERLPPPTKIFRRSDHPLTAQERTRLRDDEPLSVRSVSPHIGRYGCGRAQLRPVTQQRC